MSLALPLAWFSKNHLDRRDISLLIANTVHMATAGTFVFHKTRFRKFGFGIRLLQVSVVGGEKNFARETTRGLKVE